MKWSLPLGEIRGIKIFIHWTFLLLLTWIGMSSYRSSQSGEQALLTVGYILTLFLCVVLHEFGHAFMARRFGIKTKDITLFPMGGMARMEKIPEAPKEEFLVAIAGPLVNVVIAGALFLYMHFSPTLYTLGFPAGAMTPDKFLPALFAVNVIMAIFNLIPAFPMDGGRIFRAMLSLKLERTRATQIAAKLGQLIAIVFIALGLFYNIWLVFIGIFIYLGAGAEASQEYVQHDLAQHKVSNLVMTKFTMLAAQDVLSAALRALLDSQEREFLVSENGAVVGVLTRDEMLAGLQEHGQTVQIGKIMRRDIQFLPPQMPVTEALRIMTESNIPMLPVGYPNQLLGVINVENISEFLIIQKALR